MLLIVLSETHVLQTGADLSLPSVSVYLFCWCECCMFRTVTLRKYKFLMELESEAFVPCSQATTLSLYGVYSPSAWVKASSEMFAVQ